VIDSGTANNYVVALTPSPMSYYEGLKFLFKSANANTGASLIDVNGIGNKSIKKNVTEDLSADDIKAGSIVLLVYDGTNFQMSTGVGSGTGGGGGSLTNAMAITSLRI
jgi:hypothetical protein